MNTVFAVFSVRTGLPSPKFHDQVVIEPPVVEKLLNPLNFIDAPTAGTSPAGLCTVKLKIAKGDWVVCPGAIGTVNPLIVTWIVELLVDGAVKLKVVGSKVTLFPALIVEVPVIPACDPVPTNVTPTEPVRTVMVTVPHLTVSDVLAGTERTDPPPHTLMLAGASPPAAPEVMSTPTLGETSCIVSWHGLVGHWSPLERIVPVVVPPSGMSLKSFEKTVGWVSTLSKMPSPSVSWVTVTMTTSVKVAV